MEAGRRLAGRVRQPSSVVCTRAVRVVQTLCGRSRPDPVRSISWRTAGDPQSMRRRSPSSRERPAPQSKTRKPTGSMKVTAVRSRTTDDAPLSKACSRECSSPGALAMSSSPVARSTSESPGCSVRIVSGPCFRMEIDSNRVSLPRTLSKRATLLLPGCSAWPNFDSLLDRSGQGVTGRSRASRPLPKETETGVGLFRFRGTPLGRDDVAEHGAAVEPEELRSGRGPAWALRGSHPSRPPRARIASRVCAGSPCSGLCSGADAEPCVAGWG
jgi:hypothetical protein